MGHSQTRKDEDADKQDGSCTKDSIHAYTSVVANPCILATKLNKPLIYRKNSLKKVNMTFKRGFVVLRLAKKSAVIHLHLDSVLVFERNGVTLRYYFCRQTEN